ncbi:MAG: hypothetical protein K1X79_06895 [Oligoflexia bacterium]|nr:hypothetical protein [Oligoflexia bacterium]
MKFLVRIAVFVLFGTASQAFADIPLATLAKDKTFVCALSSPAPVLRRLSAQQEIVKTYSGTSLRSYEQALKKKRDQYRKLTTSYKLLSRSHPNDRRAHARYVSYSEKSSLYSQRVKFVDSCYHNNLEPDPINDNSGFSPSHDDNDLTPTATYTPTQSPTSTPTPSGSPSPTPTPTRTNTPGPSPTPTRTPTRTPTPTATPTSSATKTPTPTPTGTISPPQINMTLTNTSAIAYPSNAIIRVSVIADRDDFFGQSMRIEENGVRKDTQVSVLATWPDQGKLDNGSTLHAILSYRTSGITAGVSSSIVIKPEAQAPSSAFSLPAGLEDRIAFNFSLTDNNGETWTVDFSKADAKALVDEAVAGGSRCNIVGGSFGAFTRDCEQIFVPTNSTGVPHKTLLIIPFFEFNSGSNTARVFFRVENTAKAAKSDLANANFSTLSINIGQGSFLQTYSLSNRVFPYGTRFVKLFMIDTEWPMLLPQYDATHSYELANRGLFPPLFYETRITESEASKWVTNLLKGSNYGDISATEHLGIPFDNGVLYDAMGGTGERQDIGPFTKVAALLLNGSGATGILAANSELNSLGVFDIHYRDSSGELGVKHSDPWFSSAEMKSDHTYGTPNTAHMPNAATASYMMFGDKPFLEELVVRATYDLEQRYQQDFKYDRECAWGVRDVQLAAALMPDYHPLKDYMLTWVANTQSDLTNPANYMSSSPIGNLQEGTPFPSGRKYWPIATIESQWQAIWAVLTIARGEQLHNFEGLSVFRHHWKRYLEYFTKIVTWSGPYGVVENNCIDNFTCPIMDYSVPTMLYTGIPDGKGGWAETKGSRVEIANIAEAIYRKRVSTDFEFDPGKAPTQCPQGGCAPDNWFPLAGKDWVPVANNDYYRYGGIAGTCYYARLHQLQQADQVCDIYDARAQYQYDTQTSDPIGMRVRGSLP